LNIEIFDSSAFEAGEMTVRVTSVAIKTTTRPIQTFDHASSLESFEILVHRCVSNPSALIIQFFENIPRTQMAGFSPKQIKDHPPLLTQAHPKLSAQLKSGLQSAGSSGPIRT
jgi:hypothetical protein